MKTNWTNDDRVAFMEWTRSSLGSKALRYLAEGRPEVPSTFDMNQMAMSAAEIRAYDKLLERIDDMTRVSGPNMPKTDWVAGVEVD